MIRRLSYAIFILLGLCVFSQFAVAAPTATPKTKAAKKAAPKTVRSLKPPTAEELTKMKEASPKTAPATPKKPRRILVFTQCRGYVHDSIPYVNAALELMGKQTGAFECVVSDDIASFEPASLAAFDAVLMNNTTGNGFFLPADYATLAPEKQHVAKGIEARLHQSLVEFVHGGKGLIGIHAATDCNYDWPAYAALFGAAFDFHPWPSKSIVTIKIDDPASPVNASFGGKPFQVGDEIYTFKAPYSREKLHMLLSLDSAKIPKPTKAPNRTDNDFAVSWIKTEGKGRVFYCSLGHDKPIFWNAAVLEHYLRGIQYALGDLEANDKPEAK